MAEVIKEVTLTAYPKMKVGEAFQKYRHFKKKEWSETRDPKGTFYIDFIGTNPSPLLDFKARKQGISATGVEVKFVIYPNGSYNVAMISRVEVHKGGRVQRFPLPDQKSILDAIYENREVRY
jgi:hypothetical protein